MDKERVIKGLNQRCNGSMFNRCGKCPYYKFASEPFECRDKLLEDVLTLLKEQEPVKPIYRMEVLETHSGKLYRAYACSKCNTEFREQYGFCPYCGQAVKWE